MSIRRVRADPDSIRPSAPALHCRHRFVGAPQVHEGEALFPRAPPQRPPSSKAPGQGGPNITPCRAVVNISLFW
jgi:hypothetical protein